MAVAKKKLYLVGDKDHSWFNDPVEATTPEEAIKLDDDLYNEIRRGNQYEVFEVVGKTIILEAEMGFKRVT